MGRPPLVNWVDAAFAGWISEAGGPRRGACLALGRQNDVKRVQQKGVFSPNNSVSLSHILLGFRLNLRL